MNAWLKVLIVAFVAATAQPLAATPATDQPCSTTVVPSPHGGAVGLPTLARLTPLPSQWCKLELALTLPQVVRNPYDPAELDARVRFESPSGRAITVPAFWYAHPTDARRSGWRVRFTPPAAGVWRAQAIVRTFRGETRSPAITLHVAPRRAKGFVRVHPRNPRYLAFDNGDPFFPIGVNLGWWRDDPIGEYERRLDALHRNGGNATRIWMAPWSFGIEWRDTGLGNYDNRQLRAHWLDRVLEMAEQRGITVMLTLIADLEFRADSAGLWMENPYNARLGGVIAQPGEFVTHPAARRLFAQRLRYIAARWGYSTAIAAWEFWNEVDATPIDTESLIPWLQEMSAVLRTHDPNQRLITLSYIGNGDPRVWRMEEIGLTQRHEYHISPTWFRSLPGGFRPTTDWPEKPLLLSEFGYSSIGEPLNEATREGIHLHNGLWASTFSGFAGAAMYWWWDDYIEAGDLWKHLLGLSRFLQGEDLAAMRPVTVEVSADAVGMGLLGQGRALVWVRHSRYEQQEVVFAHILSQSTGAPYRFVLPTLRGVRVVLRGLPPGRYRVQWFNTRSGLPVGSQEVEADARGMLVLRSLSFDRDWAIKISAFTSSGG